MGQNTFGHLFRIHTFGESHGPALGVIIDGCPSQVKFDYQLLENELKRRRPGRHSSHFVSQRKENDTPEILSGVFNGQTIGTPISIIVKNVDAKSTDYNLVKTKPRKGHADTVWKEKFIHVDHRGGGRSSGRETVSRVMGGAVAKMVLNKLSPKTKIICYCSQLGSLHLEKSEELKLLKSKKNKVDDYLLRFPIKNTSNVENYFEKLVASGDSVGGIAKIIIKNPPKNLGQPVFKKLKSELASALVGIGAVNGIEFGEGFNAAKSNGLSFHQENQDVYGGIQGGISTGKDIQIAVSFKPTSSILDVTKKGRHDPCIVPRAIPVLEAMCNLVLVDQLLWTRLDRI